MGETTVASVPLQHFRRFGIIIIYYIHEITNLLWEKGTWLDDKDSTYS